ncbi:MAG TPA: DNA recombination protein RmuC [Rhodocyclaceae bacterium]
MNDNLMLALAAIALLLLAVTLVLAWRASVKSDAAAIQLTAIEAGLERAMRELREELARGRSEAGEEARRDRGEQGEAMGRLAQSLGQQLVQLGGAQGERLESFARQLGQVTQNLDQRFERLREVVDQRLQAMQTDNAKKLDDLRRTVDEKLHQTLEQRLGESFKIVSERLEQVQRGLGEMHALAQGVGDLKRVLTNVKTRGTWGEVQLGTMLEQVLTAEQYAANVATRPGSKERVEFAIRLPGGGDGEPVWLPIDAKFPLEDYQRLIDAQERVDQVAVEAAAKALEMRLRDEAKKIRAKYVEPPHTTDFAILYLPVEGLYAEALRRAGLSDVLQRDYRVTLAGPTTLAAMLNSLQMGFRTLAIEKRSSEVWTILGAVKHEFEQFGDALAHTKKKLNEAANSISKAETRSRVLGKKLRDVEALPGETAEALLGSVDELDELDEADTDEAAPS